MTNTALRALPREPGTSGNDIRSLQRTGPPKLILPSVGHTYLFLSTTEIICCASAGAYTTITLTENHEHLACKSLGMVAAAFDRYELPMFRTHRSHLVNLDFVTAYWHSSTGPAYLQVQGGITIPVAKGRKEAFQSVISNYHIKI